MYLNLASYTLQTDSSAVLMIEVGFLCHLAN